MFSVPAMTQWLGGSLWVFWSPSFSSWLSSSCQVTGASLGLFLRGDFSLNRLDPLSQIAFTSGDVGCWWPLSQSLGSLSLTFLRAKGPATAAHKIARFCITELDSSPSLAVTLLHQKSKNKTITIFNCIQRHLKKIIVQFFCSFSN